MNLDEYFAKWRHFISTILHVRFTKDMYMVFQAVDMNTCPQLMSGVDFEEPETPELFACDCADKGTCSHRETFMKFHNSCLAWCTKRDEEFYVFIMHTDMAVKCFTVEFHT